MRHALVRNGVRKFFDSQRALTALTILAGTTFALRSILFSTGTPAYLHDWRWPFFVSQLNHSLISNADVWDLSGTGMVNPFPLLHPIFFVWAWLSVLFGAAATLKITLVGAFLSYGLGVYACTRFWFHSSRWSARFMALAALLGPPMFTKLLAGHLYYLIALSALIWSVTLLAPASESKWWLGLGSGLIAAFTAIQIQIWVVACVLLLIICLSRLRTLGVVVSFATIFASFVFVIPELWSLHSTGGDLPFLRATFHWEMNNSAPLASAPVGMGYFAAYSDKAYARFSFGGLLRALLWSVPFAALLALIVVRDRRLLMFGGFWLACVALTAGLNGPLQRPLVFAFSRWEAASVFRELYHFAPIAWTFVCVMGARGLDVLGKGARALVTVCVLSATLAVWLPRDFADQLREWPSDPGLRANLTDLANLPGSWRVLFLPSFWPVGPLSWQSGGVDPAAYGVGDHPAANNYVLTNAQQIAFQLRERNDPRARQWLAGLGVGGEIEQADIVSRFRQISEPPHSWPPGLRVPHYGAIHHSARLITWGTPMAFASDDLQIVRSPLAWNVAPAFVLARDALSPSLTDPDLAPQG